MFIVNLCTKFHAPGSDGTLNIATI